MATSFQKDLLLRWVALLADEVNRLSSAAHDSFRKTKNVFKDMGL
jgi:hypothetical protein